MSCTPFKWRIGDDARCVAILAQHFTLPSALAAISKAFGREVSRAALDSYLTKNGKSPAFRYLKKLHDLDTGAAPAPVDVSGLDFDDDADTAHDTDRAPAPPVVEVHPVEAREARDETTRLKRQVAQLVDELRDARVRQSFLDSLDGHREPVRILPREKTSGVREMTPVVACSDWHVEEPVDPASIAYRNEYSLEIAEQRIERLFRAVMWHVEHHRASGRIAIRDLVFWLGGDLYSGAIHPELDESCLLRPVEAVRWLHPRIRNGLVTLLEELQLERLVVPCSFGNHGRTTQKPRISTGHTNSFDFLLYHALADEFRGDPRVQFEITASGHQYVEVYGRTVHFTHGDSVKFQGGVGGLGIPLLKKVPAWDRIRPADVHVIGHHHQLRDYGRALVNGSLIGYNAYAQFIGADYEPPQQLIFYVDSKRGKCMPAALWVDESERQQPWSPVRAEAS